MPASGPRLPGETGEIAAALITGERGGISEEVTQAMRDSGLAHILSISGLHMVIMAGTVFWLVRALLALVPVLALRYPIKKWAAASALAAATFYLALSGAAVPTVRSWIMMSIVLIAVMLDRPALTMRNVALAALAILIVAPESLFDPSFEMSFAAVIALVALYEWLSARGRRSLHDVSPVWARVAPRREPRGRCSRHHAGRQRGHCAFCGLSLSSHDPFWPDRQSRGGAARQPTDHADGAGEPAGHAVRSRSLAAQGHGTWHRAHGRHRQAGSRRFPARSRSCRKSPAPRWSSSSLAGYGFACGKRARERSAW